MTEQERKSFRPIRYKLTKVGKVNRVSSASAFSQKGIYKTTITETFTKDCIQCFSHKQRKLFSKFNKIQEFCAGGNNYNSNF